VAADDAGSSKPLSRGVQVAVRDRNDVKSSSKPALSDQGKPELAGTDQARTHRIFIRSAEQGLKLHD